MQRSVLRRTRRPARSRRELARHFARAEFRRRCHSALWLDRARLDSCCHASRHCEDLNDSCQTSSPWTSNSVAKKRSHAWSPTAWWITSLLVVAISLPVGLRVAQTTREAARRSACTCNQRQYGLYHNWSIADWKRYELTHNWAPPPERIQEWPLSAVEFRNETPLVVIVGATTFLYGDVPCQLLGVTESADPEVRKRALAFARQWFEKRPYSFYVKNRDNPLVRDNGVCVVWPTTWSDERPTSQHSLVLELVRAGLVEVDALTDWDYQFTVLKHSDDRSGEVSWRQWNWRFELFAAQAEAMKPSR